MVGSSELAAGVLPAPQCRPGQNVPVTVSGTTADTGIAASNLHSCAARADGTAACWGAGGDGNLGNSTNTFSSNVPVTFVGIP